eukprot:1455435-Lingulodinium_polyedra.AAC.1
MSRPRQIDEAKIKRIARYLKGCPRYVHEFCWQDQPDQATTFSDSDWAGDKTNCKSTSGGCIMLGKHLIKSWAKSQAVIA